MTVMLVGLFNLVLPTDAVLFAIGPVTFSFVRESSLARVATVVLSAIAFSWAARQIALANWHPRQDRIAHDGSLSPLFVAVWHEMQRAIGIVLFGIAAMAALTTWVEQWPLP